MTRDARDTAVEHLFIGGRWVAPSTGDTVEVVEAHTELVMGRVPAEAEVVIRAVAAERGLVLSIIMAAVVWRMSKGDAAVDALEALGKAVDKHTASNK